MIALGFMIAAILHGQDSLLLPTARTIVGLAVDQDGHPVKDAEIEHSAIPDPLGGGRTVKTGADGRFQITTKAPLIVIRKPGFTSAFLRTQEAASDHEQRFVLKTVTRTLPICSKNRKYETLEGWRAFLRFSPMKQIKVSRQGHDVDYGMRFYYLNTPHGKVGIGHGSGPTWSHGTPLDSDVWKSVKFEEDSFEVLGFRVLDSRGEWADGTRWRTIAKFGETASYSKQDKETARILDEFMDGVCVAVPRLPGQH